MPSGTGVHQGDALGLALFCMSSGTNLEKVRTQFEPQGVEVVAYMDVIGMALFELNAAAVQAVTCLKTKLLEMGVVTNKAKTVALPPPVHVPMAEVRE